ncbi:hypothetical protein ADUPG1_009886 [Aduncisulcus paluster]|uniref:Uncharacterized protein n=1 Tax=Aduncisulcus paluster TaxID=2918883 RepID=A0ABQ5KX48_9EUKA|nr:hypothetical protein ADUPG1_009886 [Aduncisulcus paluster]
MSHIERFEHKCIDIIKRIWDSFDEFIEINGRILCNGFPNVFDYWTEKSIIYPQKLSCRGKKEPSTPSCTEKLHVYALFLRVSTTSKLLQKRLKLKTHKYTPYHFAQLYQALQRIHCPEVKHISKLIEDRFDEIKEKVKRRNHDTVSRLSDDQIRFLEKICSKTEKIVIEYEPMEWEEVLFMRKPSQKHDGK